MELLVFSEEEREDIRAFVREEIVKALEGAEDLQREVGKLRSEIDELKGRVEWIEAKS